MYYNTGTKNERLLSEGELRRYKNARAYRKLIGLRFHTYCNQCNMLGLDSMRTIKWLGLDYPYTVNWLGLESLHTQK